MFVFIVTFAQGYIDAPFQLRNPPLKWIFALAPGTVTKNDLRNSLRSAAALDLNPICLYSGKLEDPEFRWLQKRGTDSSLFIFF